MNDIIQKAQLTKLFFRALLRKENLLKGYGIETTQGRATWTFIAGAVIYHLLGFYAIAAFVAADALNACWIGMKKNGYYEDPSQVLEASA